MLGLRRQAGDLGSARVPALVGKAMAHSLSRAGAAFGVHQFSESLLAAAPGSGAPRSRATLLVGSSHTLEATGRLARVVLSCGPGFQLPVGSSHSSRAADKLARGVLCSGAPKPYRSARGRGVLGLAPPPAIAGSSARGAPLALGKCFGVVVDDSEEETRRTAKTELSLSSSSIISQRQSFCHIHTRSRNLLSVTNSFIIAKRPLAMAESQANGSAGFQSLPMASVPDARVKGIAESIRAIPDFPKPGILFRDVTTLLLNPKAFKDCIDICVERYAEAKIDVVAGIEARGFIFGPPIALALGAKFVPVRKAKKLPGEVIGEEYTLEYGTDKIEIHVGAVNPGDHVILVDDLIATGGTLGAALRLMERVGGEVVECACVIELPELKGRAKLNGKPLFTVVEFEGH